jgi:hypothetical protein
MIMSVMTSVARDFSLVWATAGSSVADSVASPRTRERDRLQLRWLDACLDILERLRERDQAVVSAVIASRLRPFAPGVEPGMPVSRAVQVVLRAQEAHLSPWQDGPARSVRPPSDNVLELSIPDGAARPRAVRALTPAEALSLTERIRSTSRQMCLLLLEAHERRAWLALGYQSWRRYVGDELQLSRSRSYELLDQGRVVRAIQAAAGVSEVPDISAFAAAQLKPHLREVTDAVRAGTAGVPVERLAEVAAAVVRAHRVRIRARRDAPAQHHAGRSRDPRGAALVRLSEALQVLAHMPPPAEVSEQLPVPEPRWCEEATAALEWLTSFTQARRARVSCSR